MPLEIGTTLPPLPLRDAQGDGIPADKPAVFFFYKSTCPTCAQALPYLDVLDRAFSDATVGVWGVSQESLTVAAEFNARCGANVPTLDDSTLDASRSLDVQNVPTMYLVDANRVVQDVVIGLDKDGLNRVASTIAEWTATPPVTVAPADDGVPALRPG